MKQSLGWSAMFFAASEGYLNITRLLVNAGADVALGDKVVIHVLCFTIIALSLSLSLTHTHVHTPSHRTTLRLCN